MRLAIVRALLIGVVALPGIAASQTTPPPPLVIQSAETRWTDVYCDLLEVSRPNPGELMVRVRYRNLGKQAMRFPDGSTAMRYTEVIDPVNRLVYAPLTDSERKIISSSTIDESTMAGRSLAAGASVAHYVKMTAPPDSVTRVSVVAPGAVVFDDVLIGAKPTEKPRTTARPVI